MNFQPNHRYTFEELAQLRANPDNERKLLGYYAQHNLDGTVSFVPWNQVPGFGNRPMRSYALAGDPWGLPPIVKRTPQQRKDSLIRKWWESCRAAGTVPGLSDEKVSEIVGVDWKTGTSEMTGEIVERLAAAMLTQAEAEFEEAESHKVVRTSPTD